MSCGGVAGVEFLELRDRVLALEKTVAELAKWTKFNQQETPKKNHAAVPVANVDGMAASTNSATEAVNVEKVQNNGNREEELCAVCKAEVMDAEAENDDQQRNEHRIGNPQETSDKAPPVTPIPDDPSTGRTNEKMTASVAVGGSGTGAGQKGSINKGAIPPQIKTEEDVICQCKLEDESDCSSKEDSSNSKGSFENTEIVQKNKSTTAGKSSSSELKSPFVSLKRLSSAQILSLKNNMAMKSKPKWKCPHCPKILTWKSQLITHIRRHTGERPFSCPHCPHASTQGSSLRTHIRRIHPKENQNLYPCKICQQKCHSPKIREAHRKKHLKCYFCSLKFASLCDMGRHFAIHTGEKPFSCPHCPYSTGWEKSLKVHIRRKHQNSKQRLL